MNAKKASEHMAAVARKVLKVAQHAHRAAQSLPACCPILVMGML